MIREIVITTTVRAQDIQRHHKTPNMGTRIAERNRRPRSEYTLKASRADSAVIEGLISPRDEGSGKRRERRPSDDLERPPLWIAPRRRTGAFVIHRTERRR